MLNSCRKEHSCQCVITIEEPGYYPYTTTSTQKIDGKTSKKRAESICAYTEKQLYKYADNEITSPTQKLTASCAVK